MRITGQTSSKVISGIVKSAQKDISANRFDIANLRLTMLANLAKHDQYIQSKLVSFFAKNWKKFPDPKHLSEAINGIYPHLSGRGKKSADSLLLSINSFNDHEELMAEFKSASLTLKFTGGFHFASKDGCAIEFERKHFEFAMRLAKIWALDPEGDLEHAIEIIKYVNTQDNVILFDLSEKLAERVKCSPLPEIRTRLEKIEAAMTWRASINAKLDARLALLGMSRKT